MTVTSGSGCSRNREFHKIQLLLCGRRSALCCGLFENHLIEHLMSNTQTDAHNNNCIEYGVQLLILTSDTERLQFSLSLCPHIKKVSKLFFPPDE